jgi:hypothetical protein
MFACLQASNLPSFKFKRLLRVNKGWLVINDEDRLPYISLDKAKPLILTLSPADSVSDIL